MWQRHCGPRNHEGAGRGWDWKGDPNFSAFFWGGGHRRGGHSRGGRMFEQGDLKFVILRLLDEKPRHGYEIIKDLEERSGGRYAPSPGTVYPTLTLLEEQELIAAEAAPGGKKSYMATAKGQQFLADNIEHVKALMTRIDIMAEAKTGLPFPPSIMHAIQTLRHAILAKSGAWTEGEEARVNGILERAAREIMTGRDPV